MKQPHSLLQKAVKDALELCGWKVVRMKAGLGSEKGIPDLYCLRGGRNIWLEIKTGKQKLTKDQVEFRDDIISHGGYWRIVYTLDDLKMFGLIENILL